MQTDHWLEGYSQAELDRAQDRHGLIFPSDLIALLRKKRPAAGYDWTDAATIKGALKLPYDRLIESVKDGQLWWPEWGQLPKTAREREEVLRDQFSRAPRLIPLMYHRYLPETPHEAGNPVFSIYYTDAVYYGVNLKDYFEREFGNPNQPWPRQPKRIPFWSDLVDRA